MTREELTALRDAIDMTLALPDSIRELLAQWLTPAAAKPNGRDPHPPVPTSTPHSAKAKRAFVSRPRRKPPSASSSPRCATTPASPSSRWPTLQAPADRRQESDCDSSLLEAWLRRICPGDGN
jgi:hypothetical protein